MTRPTSNHEAFAKWTRSDQETAQTNGRSGLTLTPTLSRKLHVDCNDELIRYDAAINESIRYQLEIDHVETSYERTYGT